MKPLVLVADDDADSRAVARDALLQAGYEVLEVSDGLEAVAAADSRSPDMILMDMAMPRLDGWEAVRRLRKGSHPGVAIVAYTAHALAGDRERALAAGCDDYLAKPCGPKEVVRKAERWARREAGGTS
jgi:two-component system, cell cycle response regulator DivK